MRILTVFVILVNTNDLRISCEPIASTNPCVCEEAGQGSRMKDGVSTGRVVRDVGSATFQANIYPVQVDLTKWTRNFETKFAEITKLVDYRFNATDLLMQGLEERFDAMERRQNNSERLTSVQFEKIQHRFERFETESRLNDSRHKTDERIQELESRFNQLCSRTTEKPSLSTTTTSGFHHTVSPRPLTVAPPAGNWILIQKHNFLDKEAFKDKLWADYKEGFGDGINEFWLGLQKMNDLTKNGFWLMKVAFTFDLLDKIWTSPRRGEHAYGIYSNFRIDSEEKRFQFNIDHRIKAENLMNYEHDPVERHNQKEFYTTDKDLRNSDYNDEKYYASMFGGGWWFDDYQGFGFCANCQRDLVMGEWKDPYLANSIWHPDTGSVPEDENPSEISMWMTRVN